MEWILDPTIIAGLLTLVIIEIVLGIDNLVFIAILSEKLPKKQSDKARILGLSLALLMRFCLLFSMHWIVTLTKPLFFIYSFSFSARQLIMLAGGFFLLFKATMELNERLEGKSHEQGENKKTSKFWPVVAQIVVLDAVFSIDSVITAVGMVEHVSIMIIAVTIAMLIMILASKSLTKFVNAHPTIVILCLSFLLMIGFSLIAEGFNYHIPKGYLYAAIGFSILIEFFNQISNFNRKKFLSSNKSLRQRTADAVLNILQGKNTETSNSSNDVFIDENEEDGFKPEELLMIERVMSFAQRSVGSIMTPRHYIENINLDQSNTDLLQEIEKNQHSRLIVTNNEANGEPIGIINILDLLKHTLAEKKLDLPPLVKQPLIFPETVSLLVALEHFRNAKTHFAFVVDEFGSTEGIITLTDVMEAIAGNLPIEGEETDDKFDIEKIDETSWILNGSVTIEDLQSLLHLTIEEKREYHTLAGLLIEHLQNIPQIGNVIILENWRFEITKIENHRILKVKVTQFSQHQNKINE